MTTVPALVAALVLATTVASSSASSMDSALPPVIGIDLGTHSIKAAVYRDGVATSIPLDVDADGQAHTTLPALVAWPAQTNCSSAPIVGRAARAQALTNPTRTLFDSKRLIGTGFSQLSRTDMTDRWPFRVKPVAHDRPVYVVPGCGRDATEPRELWAEQVSGLLLRHVKEAASAMLGVNVTQAVVTVPAFFTDAQRQATIDAGAVAGLRIVRILNEPTAAAISYGLDKDTAGINSTLLVLDLGGATFDVSVIAKDEGVFEVLATSGDVQLGLRDVDKRLVDWALTRVHTTTAAAAGGCELNNASSQLDWPHVWQGASRARRALSTSTHTTWEWRDRTNRSCATTVRVTRARLETLTSDLLQTMKAKLLAVLRDARVHAGEVDKVVLVGGGSHMPMVQRLVRSVFSRYSADDDLFAQGVDPTHAVALGAAIQGGVLSGHESSHTKDLLLLDVTPLSLGLRTAGGVMTPIIPRNSLIPTKRRQVFSTNADNQDSVLIQVYQGERPLARQNHFLDKFRLQGIPKAPRGVPRIEVVYELDVNGILSVKAQCAGTSASAGITISSSRGRMSEEQIEAMVSAADSLAAQDTLTRQRVQARLDLQALCHTALVDARGQGPAAGQCASDKAVNAAAEQCTVVTHLTKKLAQETLEWLDSPTGHSATLDDLFNQCQCLNSQDDTCQPCAMLS